MRFCVVQDTTLGCLPVVGVGYFSASFAFPDGFALRRQCLGVFGQLEPIVLTGRAQKTRDEFPWLDFVSRFVGGRGLRRFFDVKLETVRHGERILLHCHWPTGHTIPSRVGILLAVK